MKKSIFLWLLYLCSSDPLDSLSLPVDTDGDFLADCVDTDDDNDGTLDTDDAFPLDPTEDTFLEVIPSFEILRFCIR